MTVYCMMSGSIVSQIEDHENKIKEMEGVLDGLERKLRLFDLPEEERNKLEKEQKETQIKLEAHRKEMKSLRFENFKTMIISAIILFVIYAVYAAYTMDSK